MVDMGAFSYIVCEKELPLPSDLGEDFNDVEWDTILFQSKSLDPHEMFNKYCISEDGQFYKEEVDFELELKLEDGAPVGAEVNETNVNGIEKQDITAEIVFSYLHLATRYDYWMEFKALFFKGELKELTLLTWEKEDAKERVELQAKITKLAKKQVDKQKTLYWKMAQIYKGIITKIFYVIRWVFGACVKLCWKIERWITPNV